MNETISELYESLFSITQTNFENVLSTYEHRVTYLENAITQVETEGYIASKKYYEYLATYEKQIIAKLEAERDALTDSLQEALDSGTIAKDSESFFEMASSIDSVTEALQEAQIALVEYEKAIEELEWEQFDQTQETISNLIDEADFLLNLLDEDDYYDERGGFTDTGLTALGLHGQDWCLVVFVMRLQSAIR